MTLGLIWVLEGIALFYSPSDRITMNKGGDERRQCIRPRVSRDTSYLALGTEGKTKYKEDRPKVFLPKCGCLYTIAMSCNYVIKFSH